MVCRLVDSKVPTKPGKVDGAAFCENDPHPLHASQHLGSLSVEPHHRRGQLRAVGPGALSPSDHQQVELFTAVADQRCEPACVSEFEQR